MKLRGFWFRLILAGAVLAALTTYLLTFPLLPAIRVVLEEGDVAPRDIRAPRRITYESAIWTAERQRQAEAAVQPVYTSPDPNIARQQLERVRQILDYLNAVRADPFGTSAQRRAWVLAVPELRSLPLQTADALLALPEDSWNRVQLEIQKAVEERMRQGVREDAVDQAQQEIPTMVGLDLSPEEASVTVALAQRLIVPNSFYDEAATQEARQQARASVPPVVRTFEANEIIVREGQRVTALDLEALRELGLQQPHPRYSDIAASGIFAILSLLLLAFFLRQFQPDVLQEWRKLLLLAILWALFLFLARVMVPDRTVLRYLFPAPALAMLATATLGAPAGLALSVLMGGVVGIIGDHSLELGLYAAAGGIVGALALRRADRLTNFFHAALLVSIALVSITVATLLPRGRPNWMEVGLTVSTAAMNGLISASLTLGGLFFLGPPFDLLTPFRLLELSRPDQPLLQRLLREAPGTYHHSLVVASLAEQAAEQIGLNPLLVRVGAYYHDIGKIARPYFFVENQLDGNNPHDKLDPYTSARVIAGHVRDGIELARRYRLPSRIRAFITEHHGTNRMRFQYQRAVDQAGNVELVKEEEFHHTGPRPQSRETALVMLADQCEAVVRARRPQTLEELTQIVEEVFQRTLEDGQLDECPITMRELRAVRESFISSLKGVFHPRLPYLEVPPEPRLPKTDKAGIIRTGFGA